eukprot:g11277.t1
MSTSDVSDENISLTTLLPKWLLSPLTPYTLMLVPIISILLSEARRPCHGSIHQFNKTLISSSYGRFTYGARSVCIRHNRRRRLGVTRKRSKNAEKPGSCPAFPHRGPGGESSSLPAPPSTSSVSVVQERGELLNRSIFSPRTPTPTPKAQVKLVFAHTRTASSSSTSFSRLTQLGSGKAEADVEEEVIVEDKLRHALTCTHKLVQRIEWGDEKIVMERYRNQYQEIVIASMPRVRAGKGEEGNVARKAKRRRKKRRDAVVAGLTELVDEAQGISKEDLEEGQTMINEMGEQWGKVGATGEDLRHRAYQLLLYCDTAVATVTETVVEQFRLKGSADRQSASVDFDAVMSYFYELLKDSKLVEGEDSNKLKEIHLALGGDGRKTGANLRSVVLAAKLFPVDVNCKPLAPMPTPTSQDALFPLLIAKCNEKQEELEVVCQDVLRRLEKEQDAGGWKHPTTGVTLPTIKLCDWR